MPCIFYVNRKFWPKCYKYLISAVSNIILDKLHLVNSNCSIKSQAGGEKPSSGQSCNYIPENIFRHKAFTGELAFNFVIHLQYCLSRNALEDSGKSRFAAGQQYRSLSPGFWQVFWLAIVIKHRRRVVPPIPRREVISIFLTTLRGSSAGWISYHYIQHYVPSRLALPQGLNNWANI